jgi:PhoH-like ATPase
MTQKINLPTSNLRKTFILDTNVLLSDIRALESFEDNDVVIPLAVLEELDHNKKRMDEVGRNARAVCRYLDSFRQQGSLHDWVPINSGGRLCVMMNGDDVKDILPPELLRDKNDNLVIGLALSLKKRGVNPIVISKDINVRVKCDALGISAQDYLKQRAAELAEHLYTGVAVKEVDDETLASIYTNRSISSDLVMPDSLPNQIVVIPKHEGGQTTITRRINNELVLVKEHRNIFGLNPRNKEQNFALDLLLDDSVKLVTLVGAAGCGKTLIALAAGLQMTLGPNPKYDKLVVTRPIEPLGRDIGYLPGSMEEKMAPWIAPIRDNLDFLFGVAKKGKQSRERSSDGKRDPYVDLLFEEGKIEIEAVTYIRGRSISNAYILIDEAQNLTVHQLKTIITRSGENSKIILAGDIHQVDVNHMDAVSNGLSYVVEAFKKTEMAGHVSLLKGERSPLATLASEIL